MKHLIADDILVQLMTTYLLGLGLVSSLSAQTTEVPSHLQETKRLFASIQDNRLNAKTVATLDKTIKIAQQVVASSPASETGLEAQEMIITCHERLADHDKKFESISKYSDMIEKRFGTDAAVSELMSRADKYFLNSNYFDARKTYDLVVKKYGAHRSVAKADFKIAECYKAVECYRKAIKHYGTVRRRYPKTKWAGKAFKEQKATYKIHMSKDFAMANARDPNDEIQAIVNALELFDQASDRAELYYRLTSILIYRQGRLREALDIYLKARNEIGDSGFYMFVLRNNVTYTLQQRPELKSGYSRPFRKHLEKILEENILK